MKLGSFCATLFGVAAIVAIAPVSASENAPAHAPYTVLFNQNYNFGPAINSQISGTTYDDGAANVFKLPVGKEWYISEIDVTGSYASGSGRAQSMTITFYKHHRSGPILAQFNMICGDSNGAFFCVLPTGRHNLPAVKIAGGKPYWVSVAANCTGFCTGWGWDENTAITGGGRWENPSNGFGTGCTVWKTFSTCFGSSNAGLAFQLWGQRPQQRKATGK